MLMEKSKKQMVD